MTKVTEHAVLTVTQGRQSEFESALIDALPLIRRAQGCLDASVSQCVENPQQYLLLVRWRTLEDHTEGFRNSKDFKKWRELLWDFYDPKPEVTHFVTLGTGEIA